MVEVSLEETMVCMVVLAWWTVAEVLLGEDAQA
jgi:hypothetical protein